MEELIELIKKKYPTFYYMKVYDNGSISIMESGYQEDDCIDEFDSLEDLRNHLNE